MTGGADGPEIRTGKLQHPPHMLQERIVGKSAFQHGKTPQSVQERFSPLPHEHPAAGTDQKDRIGYHLLGLCFREDRQIGGITGVGCIAEGREGTTAAVRRTGNADGRTQIHDCLIIVPGTLCRDQGSSKAFDAAARIWFQRFRSDAEDPGKNADHVSVHRRYRYIIGNGSNSSRRIRTDPADLPHFVRIVRQDSAVFQNYLLRSFPEIPGTRIIPEPFPRFQHILLRGSGQRSQIGKTGQKTLIIRKDRFHPGLLKHRLTDPGAIGIVKTAPGQVPGTSVIPGKKGGRDLFHDTPQKQFLFIPR